MEEPKIGPLRWSDNHEELHLISHVDCPTAMPALVNSNQ